MSEATISFPGLGIVLSPSNYFTVFGHRFYYYGMIIALGFLVAAYYISRRCQHFGLTKDNIIDIVLSSVPVGIIGARAYYVAFRADVYFGNGNWTDIFKIWEGGLAIYGGIIAGALGIVIYCLVKKIPIGTALDVAGFGVMIGQIFGRWGNFFNREAFGSETDSFLRMGLTTSTGTIYVHPTFLYESVWNIIGLIFLHFFSKKKRSFDGQMFLMYVAWYGLGRFWIEGLRTDSLYLGSTDIRISQLVAACSFVVAVVLIIIGLSRARSKGITLYVDRNKADTNEEQTDAAETVNNIENEEN